MLCRWSLMPLYVIVLERLSRLLVILTLLVVSGSKIKHNSDGIIEHFKALLIAKGSNEEEGVFMAQPLTYIDDSRPTNASRAWYTKLTTYLVDHHFTPCKSDTSLLVKASACGVTYVLINVDDLVITGSNPIVVDKFVQALIRPSRFRILVTYTMFSSMILSQKKYRRELLLTTHMEDCKPICSLVESGFHLVYEGDPMFDPHLYRSMVGAIQYAIITRPKLFYVSVSIHASTERDSLGFRQTHSPITLRGMSIGLLMVMIAGHNMAMLYIMVEI
ncbi:LOW QUALITY PROTEIN: hypothetical protein V2J09_016253 [Rumex salicifolius]